jgi:hypothetical protein
MTDNVDLAAALRSAANALARLAALDLDVEELERVAKLRDTRRRQRRLLASLSDDVVARGLGDLDIVKMAAPSPTDALPFEVLVRGAAHSLVAQELAAYESRTRVDEYRRLEWSLGVPDSAILSRPLIDAAAARARLAQALRAVEPKREGSLPDMDRQRTLAALLLWADRLADDGVSDPRDPRPE